ncbi:MAG: hypothetical protein WAT70_02225 [Rhizobiaceae bacterium]
MTAGYRTWRELGRVALATLIIATSPAGASELDPGTGKGLQFAETNPIAKPRSARQRRIQACERKVFIDFARCADVCDNAFPEDEPAAREVCTRACEADAQRQYRKCDRIL